MNMHHLHGIAPLFFFVMLLVIYIGAVIVTNRRYKKWPRARIMYWCIGTLLAAVAVVGPVAERAHMDFTVHMVSHILLGMLAPLLLVLAAPMTLVLRALRTDLARLLSSVLKSAPARLFTHPVVATVLNIGGLWLLYTTDLYTRMHDNSVIYFFVHVHVFVAGYLFTLSLISIEPIVHRKSFIYRSIVLICALAGHGILAKYLYAHPPQGVSVAQAERGSMVMYYGGDLVDALLIFILCLQWYKATKPRAEKLQPLKVNDENA